MTEAHGPRSLRELSPQAVHQLRHRTHVPHTIVYGREGCGKLTLALAWLAELFGPGVWSMQARTLDVRCCGRSVSLPHHASAHHLLVDPALLHPHDRPALTDFVLTMANSGHVARLGSERPYKVIVVRSADLLPHEVQCALRDVLERHVETCRLVLLTRALGRLQDPLISRCAKVRLQPDDAYMLRSLTAACEQAGLAVPTAGYLADVVAASAGNFRQALGQLDELRYGVRCPDELAALLAKVAGWAARAEVGNHARVRDALHSAIVTTLQPERVLHGLAGALLAVVPESSADKLLDSAARAEEFMGLGASPMACLDLLYYSAAVCCNGDAA